MSLILEALRKSEAERRRSDTPDVHAELPPAPPRPRPARIPAWGWGLLALAALPLAWWAATDRNSPSPPPAPTPETATPPKVAASHPAATSLPPVPRLSPPPAPAVAAPGPPTAVVTEPAERPLTGTAPPAVTAPSLRVPTPIVAPTGESDGTMQLSDLSAEERKALPPLKLSMHMWSDDPARRFLILDGNRLGEGDRVGNAVVTAITPDGAVLDWNGRRIRLPMR